MLSLKLCRTVTIFIEIRIRMNSIPLSIIYHKLLALCLHPRQILNINIEFCFRGANIIRLLKEHISKVFIGPTNNRESWMERFNDSPGEK